MKTSLTKSKSSLVVALTLLAAPIWAKPVVQVTEVTGQVFTVAPDGKTKTLKVNDHIEEKSEVMVEEGANITFNDYYDATYHMIGGTHVKIFDKSVQLKKGKTWIQSHNSRHPLAITTANGHVDFWKAEFIATFDQSTSRTQVLVVNNEAEISNVLDKNMKYIVTAGTFSLIDPEIDNGMPRTPVKVGLASLNNALAEFKQLPQKIKEATPARSIASVESEEKPIKKGEIIFMTAGRLPASVSGQAHDYFKKQVKVIAPKKSSKEIYSTAKINYYGTSWKPIAPSETGAKTNEEAARIPASVPPSQGYKLPKNLTSNVIPDPEFSSSLKKHSAEQPKYSKELDTLIQDLKSY
jgi:hypothetical protein